MFASIRERLQKQEPPEFFSCASKSNVLEHIYVAVLKDY
jgi:hypothetical protein